MSRSRGHQFSVLRDSGGPDLSLVPLWGVSFLSWPSGTQTLVSLPLGTSPIHSLGLLLFISQLVLV